MPNDLLMPGAESHLDIVADQDNGASLVSGCDSHLDLLSGIALAPTLLLFTRSPPRRSTTVLTTETADVANDIMARLKAETAPLHERLDATVEPMLADLARYRKLLASLRNAYGVIEHELATHAVQLARAGYDLAARSKLRWLDDDLSVVGELVLATIPMTYSLSDASAAFGAVYVIEGATLGGQVIARQVIPSLALAPERGCRFFSGYGSETGERWRDTRDAIAAHLAATSAPDAAEETIAAAKMTFTLIETSLRMRICS